VRTNHYPCPFLVKHVLLSKVSMGWNAKLVLVGWKGYHNSASNKVSFWIGTARKADNVEFDLGIYLIAHFYRMGASGDAVTPEDLWDRENVPPIPPEFNASLCSAVGRVRWRDTDLARLYSRLRSTAGRGSQVRQLSIDPVWYSLSNIQAKTNLLLQ
jgi:hypothetical protein